MVRFGMQNRTFGPYLAAINRTLISLMWGWGLACSSEHSDLTSG
jgi:hypothetical protein